MLILKRFLQTFLVFTFIISLLLTYLFWGPGGLLRATPLLKNAVVYFPKGTRTEQMAVQLLDQKIIQSKYAFYLGVILTRAIGPLKAGEYEIAAKATPLDIILQLIEGRTLLHKVTIPEGYTVAQVAEVVNSLPQLDGEITHLPPEGQLLPETYFYGRGDSRQSLIDRMHKDFQKTLESIWRTRDLDFPLKTPEEAVILASIVERETPLPQERARIAAVYLNRLRQKIRLQADPTIIYGLTLGKAKMERPLTYADLRQETPFNTYINEGLPPTPIACPGKHTLQATLHPLKTDELYFVADGKGGHEFSKTYAEHQRKVAAWRQIQRQKR